MTRPQVEEQPAAEPILDSDGSASFVLPDTETLAEDSPAASETSATAPAPEQQAAPVGPLFDTPEQLRRPEVGQQSGLSDVERQELIRLRQRGTEFDQGQQRLQQSEELNQLQRQYQEQYNLDETTAKFVADEVRKERQKGSYLTANFQAQTEFQNRQRNAAIHFGKQYGVNPAALANAPDEVAMEEKAASIQHMGKMQKELDVLNRGKIPEQHLSNGGQAIPVTSDNIDALYLQGRVSEERYAKFLEDQG